MKSGWGNKTDVHVANWKKKKYIHINPNPYKHQQYLENEFVESTKNCTQNLKQNYQCMLHHLHIYYDGREKRTK